MKKILCKIFGIKKKETHYETLVNPKPRTGLKRIYTLPVFIGLLFLANGSKAQISFDMGAGYDCRAKVPIMRLGVGMEKNNAVMSLKMDCPLSRKVAAPLYLGGSLGYDIKGFIPAIGYYNFYTSDGSKKVNKGVLSYSLSYNLIVNDNGGLFFEGNYIGNSIQLTTGFHVVF